MQTELSDDVWTALQDVTDPEMPTVSVVDLGIIRKVEVTDQGVVHVHAAPTFSGCPALGVIERDVVARVARVPGVSDVVFAWEMDDTWSSASLNEGARRALIPLGVAVETGPSTSAPACPYCESVDVVRVSEFGGTLCRSVYRCSRCRNHFEAMKFVAPLEEAS